MAILFELVVNYGHATEEAERAGRMFAAAPPLSAGGRTVPLHEPSLRHVLDDDEGYLELAVIPAAVSYGYPPDNRGARLDLADAELRELGLGLYALLAGCTGFRAARVGWDPEGFVDVAELREDWGDELAAGTLPGLVLADDLAAELGATKGFVPFAPGYVWLPYTGDRPLDADLR